MAPSPCIVFNYLISQCSFFDTTLFTCTWRNADLATCRKPPAKSAWTQGTNPITQRPTHSPTPNGAVNSPKPPQSSTAASADSVSAMRHLSDRMMYLLANLTVSDSWPSMRHESARLMIINRDFPALSHLRMARNTPVYSQAPHWIPASCAMSSRWSRSSCPPAMPRPTVPVSHPTTTLARETTTSCHSI